MNVFLMIVVAALVFGAVIFVHELGHFIVAKKSGIKVNEFALGMGPTILKKKKGDTTYALRLLPIGGFVSMEGEDEESTHERSFQRAPIGKRILVIIMGAVMNMVFGFLAVVVLLSSSGMLRTSTVAQFMPDATTEATGLRVGDTILRVNGRRCFTVDDLSYEFSRIQSEDVDLVVRRDGETITLTNVRFAIETVADEATGDEYRFMVPDFKVLGEERTFFSVMRHSFNTTISYARMIYINLLDLIAGRLPVNSLSGPVGIVSGIGQAMKIGWRPVVQMLALISINLGIVNMLPLPALDGGRAVLLLVEAVRKKPIKQKYEIAINLVGFGLLMVLMVFVSFNDIRRLFV